MENIEVYCKYSSLNTQRRNSLKQGYHVSWYSVQQLNNLLLEASYS